MLIVHERSGPRFQICTSDTVPKATMEPMLLFFVVVAVVVVVVLFSSL